MKKETRLTLLGRDPAKQSGAVNAPLYQTSTVLFPTLESYHQAAEKGELYYEASENATVLDYSYGIAGTPTTFALQEALRELEGGDGCVITQSGLSAITLALQSFLSSGDHLLMVDNVYGPSRRFCNKELKKFGVATTYYNPTIGARIAELIQDNTKVIFLESPGSLTFEVQDTKAIADAAKAKGAITIFDNSWATPLFYNPLEHGVDIVIQAVTKYIGGHSDLLLGAVITKGDDITKKVLQRFRNVGTSASPYDCWLALRGLRSLAPRLKYQQESTFKIVDWIKQQPEVAQVLYPADPDDAGYALWTRDFTGAASLFSVILDKKYAEEAVAAYVDGLELFGIGASWGGYESLVVDFDPVPIRTATQWSDDRTCLRFYIGLEDLEDLIVDLEKGFGRLKG